MDLPGAGKKRPYRRFVRPLDQRRTVVRTGTFLVLMVVLHTLAMIQLEGMPLRDALWLTLTTVTTVGYGDVSADTVPGRIATVVLLYMGAIYVMVETARTYFVMRGERRTRMLQGRWRWKMKDHILLLNIPIDNPEQYLCRLVAEFRASHRLCGLPMLIVTDRFPGGLPETLLDMGAVHYHGSAIDPADLAAAGAKEAAIIVVLAKKENDKASDGRTFDVLHRLRDLGARGRILAECVADSNRKRLEEAGATIVIRPLRGYPEMIVRALVAPGAEYIMEDLFNSRGNECWRYDVRVDGIRWSDVVRTLAEHDIGVPIGYRQASDRSTRVNPAADCLVEADKLFVLVREGNSRPDREVAALLNKLGSARPLS